MKDKISIVIPAYNEAKRLPKTLKIISDFCHAKDFNYEIILVDDGSKDDTAKVAESLNIKNFRVESYSVNRGKGYAVNYGVKKSTGKYILFADADNSTPFEEVERLLDEISQNDVVIGSRYLEHSNVKLKQPLLRRLMARLGNLLIQVLILPGFVDTQCGFKLFHTEAAKKIFERQTIWRWGFDMEILYIAKKLRYKIKQVPVDWYNDEDSRIQSSKVFLQSLSELFKIKRNALLGRYRD